jgi:uncharacterized protein (DUF1778 family)
MAVRQKDIQFSIRTDSDTKARAARAAEAAQMTLTEFVEVAVRERADAVLARQDQILLSDRDFLLFEELMTRAVEPNDLVRAEVAQFNQGRFDAQGRYHW